MSIQFRIEPHDEVTSTSDLVREQALAGAAEGLVIRAEVQTRGRGRLGRQWSSPRGNLYSSMLLRPEVPPVALPSLSLVIALALARAIGPIARLKWPNDVLIGDAKTAGILLEAEAGAVIVGTGVNITTCPQGLPYPTTCLAAAGIALTADALLERMLAELRQAYPRWLASGFGPFRAAWLARGPAPGQTLRIREGDTIRPVEFRDIAQDGALEVMDGGRLRRLTSIEGIVDDATGTGNRAIE